MQIVRSQKCLSNLLESEEDTSSGYILQCDPFYFTFGQGTQIPCKVQPCGGRPQLDLPTSTSKSIGMDRFWRLNDIDVMRSERQDLSKFHIYGLNVQKSGDGIFALTWRYVSSNMNLIINLVTSSICTSLSIWSLQVYALHHQFGHFKTFLFMLTWRPLKFSLIF